MNFDKNGHQCTLFPLQPSVSDDADHENGYVQKIMFYCLKSV